MSSVDIRNFTPLHLKPDKNIALLLTVIHLQSDLERVEVDGRVVQHIILAVDAPSETEIVGTTPLGKNRKLANGSLRRSYRFMLHPTIPDHRFLQVGNSLVELAESNRYYIRLRVESLLKTSE